MWFGWYLLRPDGWGRRPIAEVWWLEHYLETFVILIVIVIFMQWEKINVGLRNFARLRQRRIIQVNAVKIARDGSEWDSYLGINRPGFPYIFWDKF